jgi:dephospho-CoA kinase
VRAIGLTGGVASGKSTVAALLRDRGIPVVDADHVAREVVAPKSPGLVAVATRFGPSVVRPDGSLDRGLLRSLVAADAQARADLEAITHPRIRAEVGRRLLELGAAGHAIAVVEAALLVETGSYKLYDTLVVVRCRPEVQLARLCARDGMEEGAARAWIAAQLPVDEKAKVATAVVDNDGDLDSLRAEVERVWGMVGVSR